MPTIEQQLADHAVYQLSRAVSDLFEVYRTPEGNAAIRADLKGLTEEWVKLGDLLKLAATNSEQAA